MNLISKFISSRLSGHLALIQLALLIAGAVWLFWSGYDLCKAGQGKATSERQSAQIEGEIQIGKDTEELNKMAREDNGEGSDLDYIIRGIKRLY
jgi:hypothetical protein